MFDNFKYVFKRCLAYGIDFIIVFSINWVISLIPFLNTYKDDYYKLTKEYNEFVDEYTDISLYLNEAYKDKVISDTEYEKLITYDYYKDYFNEVVINEELSDDGYSKIQNSIYNKAIDISKENSYYISRETILSTVILIVINVLYFGVFQYLFGGQTFGKKITNLKVVSNSDRKINILLFIVRIIILENIIFSIAKIGCLLFLNYNKYYSVSEMINTAVSLVEVAIVFMIFSRKDGRGLHDMIAGTKVIMLDRKKEVKKVGN